MESPPSLSRQLPRSLANRAHCPKWALLILHNNLVLRAGLTLTRRLKSSQRKYRGAGAGFTVVVMRFANQRLNYANVKQ